MATQSELVRRRKLLERMGLPPVRAWPPRCTWHNPDGNVKGTLQCAPYSRLLYLGRGLRPGIAGVGIAPPVPGTLSSGTTVTLVDAVVALVDEVGTLECMASELLTMLEGLAYEVPVDATRMSKVLTKLASQLAVRGIAVERIPRGRQRGIRLMRR